jgi:diguanylate cyclase (GGDEF)-like protein
LQAVVTLLGDEADVGLFSREPQGEICLKVFAGPSMDNPAVHRWGELFSAVRPDGTPLTLAVQGRNRGALVLRPSELATEQLILAYELEHGNPADLAERIACVARIYGNQIELLDYSELDTLTRLLNRKTFDETFDRLLTAVNSRTDEIGSERRDHREAGSPAWLCVIDIDHFKRVNDSFGHLFGDEVLLRMGDLMRKTFRCGDRLFRFGGEEFVVILNAEDEELASKSFNRFRVSVQNHEFPQVGQVTCSIGYTAVSAQDVPTDVVGRADEALYYAKEHGRNQVCCHERLVAEGAIAKPAMVESAAADDFDIDALFG